MTENTMAPAALRPSQLYLNAGKLAAVLERMEDNGSGEDCDSDFDPEPLPVYEFDGDLHLTDGRTRAFVAHLAGVDRCRRAAERLEGG